MIPQTRDSACNFSLLFKHCNQCLRVILSSKTEYNKNPHVTFLGFLRILKNKCIDMVFSWDNPKHNSTIFVECSRSKINTLLAEVALASGQVNLHPASLCHKIFKEAERDQYENGADWNRNCHEGRLNIAFVCSAKTVWHIPLPDKSRQYSPLFPSLSLHFDDDWASKLFSGV